MGTMTIKLEEDMKEKHLDRPERRRFLHDMVALGGTTALLAVGGTVQANAGASVSDPLAETPSGGYRLTPHINDYYRTLRF
jgi:hypothetical protein